MKLTESRIPEENIQPNKNMKSGLGNIHYLYVLLPNKKKMNV